MSSNDPSRRALSAGLLCEIQPEVLRSRLLADGSFLARFAFAAQNVVSIGGGVKISVKELLSATRRLLDSRQPQRLVDTGGRPVSVVMERDTIILTGLRDGEKRWEAAVPQLMILSPHRDERVTAVDMLLRALGPAVPTFRVDREVASQRALTDEEASELMAEALSGTAAVHERIQHMIETGATRVVDLVPEDLTYYEKFCGPDPGMVNAEEYLHGILAGYRRQLMQRELGQGLRICLWGALRDDLSPGEWTSAIPDDELWTALEEWMPERSPFALLGAVDIALRRQQDERFRDFAEVAIERLLHEGLPRCGEVDSSEMFPLFAQLTLNRLNTMEGGATRAPFWKRMCAWMQAGLLADVAQTYGLEGPGFREWVTTQLSIAGVYAQMLDLRREPMFLAAEMSRVTLRAEVLGRLQILRARAESLGIQMSGSAKIEAALRESDQDPFQIGWVLPGPLEGHCRPALLAGRRVREEEAEMLTRRAGADPGGSLLGTLAFFSQRFDLGEMLLSAARDVVRNTFLSGSREEQEAQLQSLAWGGLLAAAQRDTELARAIGIAIASGARVVTSEEIVGALLRDLLLAGAAFDDEQEWSRWIEEQLSQVAAVLPRGKATRMFLEHLAVLKTVVDLTLGIHVRAEALALAAD